MKLTKEQEEKVLENQKLIYFTLKKMGISQASLNYEDLVSEANVALIRAAMVYDPSRRCNFSTHAVKCVKNAIINYTKKSKKYSTDISLDETVGNTAESQNPSCLVDMIKDPKADFEDAVEQKDIFLKVINVLLNILTPKYSLVLLYRANNMSHQEIATRLQITCSRVSQIEQKGLKKILEALKIERRYIKKISVDMVEDRYKVSFEPEKLGESSQSFLRILKRVKVIKNFHTFFGDNEGQIILILPAWSDVLEFIAEILQELEDLNKKEQVATFEKQETEEKEKSADAMLIEKKEEVKLLKKYMAEVEFFSISDLRRQFGNIDSRTINNLVYYAKKTGSITAVGRGEYQAVKRN